MSITACAIFIQIGNTMYTVWHCEHVVIILRFQNVCCNVPETRSLIGYCLHVIMYNVQFILIQFLFLKFHIYIYIYIYIYL